MVRVVGGGGGEKKLHLQIFSSPLNRQLSSTEDGRFSTGKHKFFKEIRAFEFYSYIQGCGSGLILTESGSNCSKRPDPTNLMKRKLEFI